MAKIYWCMDDHFRWSFCGLIHWGRSKIVAILKTFSNVFSWTKPFYFDLNITEICSQGEINNNPALVQIVVWRRTGDKPVSEPMMAPGTDAHMRHSASMVQGSIKSLGMWLKGIQALCKVSTCYMMTNGIFIYAISLHCAMEVKEAR